MVELIWPWFLVLLPLPLLLHWLAPARKPLDQLRWAHVSLLQQHQGQYQHSYHLFARGLMLLAWCALVAAIARPVWLGTPTQITPSGRDLMVAVDLSGSMQVTDMTINDKPADRLAAAKAVLSNFISERKGDRIGIILFGTKAYLQAPLSFDLPTIEQFVQEAQIGFAGEQTAIGDAIGLAIKRLQDKPADKKVLILMTDGANTAGRVTPLQAANFAAQEGVRIHTIGIGADSMVVQGFFGPKVINPSTDLDEPLLTEVANLTGGQYFRARSTNELARIYRLLDELEPTPATDTWQRPKTTLFHWLGLLSLVSFALSLWFGHHVQIRGKKS
ncbi:VWA domain-containing protein [Maribrevibacterium harenarium]|uniref:VWA domain-containing protein n=1 Tax=Maribrevibacterium harenarium TaxID=2589817 RepID=A0A501WPD9_9GAMM|nr:VWA domain-containing protein [Maribrevibacterium harenarium]TPE51309.1 VWA domain-containing protein [Maribrevibacterium harenarium]